jgi:hypothetical protein
MRAFVRICAALVPLALVHQAPPPAAPAPPALASTGDPDAIFAKAQKALLADAYPRYATYDVVTTFTNAKHHTDTWATTEDLTHASVWADIFSQQERESPAVPHGVNIGIGVNLPDAQQRTVGANGTSQTQTAAVAVVDQTDDSDPVGPVALAVDQNAGLTDPRPYVVVHTGETFSSRADGFTTIGRTGGEVKRYDVKLASIDAGVAHLLLTPLRDPYHNRLRELWIEVATGHVQASIVKGVGSRPPIDQARFKVTYVRRDGGTYIASERTLDTIHFGDGDDVNDLTFTFQIKQLTSTAPKYTFGISTDLQTLHDP